MSCPFSKSAGSSRPTSSSRRLLKTLGHLRTEPTAVIGQTESGGAVAAALGGSGTTGDDDPYEIENTYIDLDGLGIPCVGTDSDLTVDYIAGLKIFRTRVDPVTKLGYCETSDSGDVLTVYKPEHVVKILSSSVQHFLGGLRPASAAFFGPKVLFILEGREWLDLRNVLKRSFQMHNVAKMAGEMSSSAQFLVDILRPYAKGKQGGEVDFMRACAAYHLHAIGRVAFDFDLGTLDRFEDGEHIINQSFEFLLDELPRRAFSTDWETQNDYETDNIENRQLADMSWQVRDVIRSVIRTRLAEIDSADAPKRTDLLQKMIDVFVEDYPESMGDTERLTQELGDNLVEIMFAGYNTAVPTTCHALFFLSQRPDLLARVREEVDRVCGERMPTYEDYVKLEFTRNVFYETLRMVPPAALISRQTTKDLDLDGVQVPRATRVWMPACVIHTDSDNWEDPLTFNPDRFDAKVKRGTWFPFSDGPRNCAGRNFALLEGVTGIALLFRNYDLRPCEDMDWKTIFTGFGLRPFDENTARVCMRLTVHPRS